MRFFVLERHPDPGEVTAVTEFLYADNSPMGEAPRCPVCREYIGMLPLLPPIRVELETWESDLGDFAFGTGDELLVSDRFWKLYQGSGLTGLSYVGTAEVIKVKSHRKLRQAMLPYHCCGVIRSRAAVDDAKSGLERQKEWTCEECRSNGLRSAKRIVLEPNSWSGEDIFYARGLPGRVLASEKFHIFCRDHGLQQLAYPRRGILFRPLFPKALNEYRAARAFPEFPLFLSTENLFVIPLTPILLSAMHLCDDLDHPASPGQVLQRRIALHPRRSGFG